MLIDQYSEEPEQNQYSFGPSNQNTTFESRNPQSPNTGITGGGLQSNIQQAPQNSALPWQDSPWQQQQVGHGGTTQGGMNREQWRDAWMSSGTSNINDMQNWMQQNGGTVLSGNGTVLTPFGEILDIGTAYRTGQGRPGWTPVGSDMNLQAGAQNPFVGQNPFGPQNPSLFNQVGSNPGGQFGMGNLMQILQQMFGGNQDGIARPHVMPRASLFGNNPADANQTMDISSFLQPQRSFNV